MLLISIASYSSRHVHLPPDITRMVPKKKLLSEAEWRDIGVQMSRGWVHYMLHDPEPHILLFRRKITTPPPE